MTHLKIVTFPDEFLAKPTEALENIDGNVQEMIDKMTTTMYEAPGIGLAAIQVYRVCFVGKQVDGRRAVQLKILGANFYIWRKNPAEMESQADLIGLHSRKSWRQPFQVYKPECFRKTQVFLQDPVTRIGVLRVRQQCFIAAAQFDV